MHNDYKFKIFYLSISGLGIDLSQYNFFKKDTEWQKQIYIELSKNAYYGMPMYGFHYTYPDWNL